MNTIPMSEADPTIPKFTKDLWEYAQELCKNETITFQEEDIAVLCLEKFIKSDESAHGNLSLACRMISDIYRKRSPKTIHNYEKTIEMLKKSLSYPKLDKWTDGFFLLEALTAHPELYGFSAKLASPRASIKEFYSKSQKVLCGEGFYKTAINWAQHVIVKLKYHHTDEDIATFEFYVDEGMKHEWTADTESGLCVLKGMIYHYFQRKNRDNYETALKYYQMAIKKDVSSNGNKYINAKPLAYFHYCDLVKSPQDSGFHFEYFKTELAEKVSREKHHFLIEGGIQSYRFEIERLLGNQTATTKWLNYYLGRQAMMPKDIEAAIALCNEAISMHNADIGEKTYVYTLKGWIYQHLKAKTVENFAKALENYITGILKYQDSSNDDKYWAIQRAFECLLPLLLNPAKYGYNIDKNESDYYKKIIHSLRLFRKNIDQYPLKANIKLALSSFASFNAAKLSRYDEFMADRETEMIINCIYCDTINSDNIKMMTEKVDKLFTAKAKFAVQQSDIKQDNYYLGFISTFSRAYKLAQEISLQNIDPWVGTELPNLGGKFLDYLPFIGEELSIFPKGYDFNKYFEDAIKPRANNLWNFIPSHFNLVNLVQDAIFERVKNKNDEIQSAVNDQALRDWQSQLKIEEDGFVMGQPAEFFLGVKDAVVLININISKGRGFAGKLFGYLSDDQRISMLISDNFLDNSDVSKSLLRASSSQRTKSNSFFKFLSTKHTVNVNEIHVETESPVKEDLDNAKKKKNSKKECCSIF